MRIIGYLDHPGMVITVFRNDNKISVKFEKNLLEMSFKIREDLHLSELSDVRNLFDEMFLREIEGIFEKMAGSRDQGLLRYEKSKNIQDDFEII